jgi:hypothetical protein
MSASMKKTTDKKTETPAHDELEQTLDIALDDVIGGCAACGNPNHVPSAGGQKLAGTVYDAFFRFRR